MSVALAKRYKEVAARSRVPLGFLLLLVYAVFARPSRERLIAGALVALAGIALRAWATGHLDKNRDLCTSGPYAHTRNPLVLGHGAGRRGIRDRRRRVVDRRIVRLSVGIGVLAGGDRRRVALAEPFSRIRAYAERVPRFWPSLRAAVPSTGRFSGWRYTARIKSTMRQPDIGSA